MNRASFHPMKKNLIAIFILPLFTSAAFAGPNGGLTEFCQAPYKSVCGESQQETNLRTERIQRIEESLKKPALAAVQQLLGNSSDLPKDFDESDFKYITPKAKRKKAVKVFLAELRTQLRHYLTDNKIPSDLQVPAIKESLLKAIQSSQEISADIRQKMQQSVRETRIISITDVDTELLENTSRDVIEMYHGCSKNMFMDNAFATEMGQKKVVIICPGEIIGSVEFAKEEGLPAGYEIGPLIMTLGHELSHHFDFTVYPEAYNGLLQHLNKADSYGAEITADIWGLKAFAIATASLSNSPYRNTLTRGALNDLCGTSDDGEHPDGAFRMNVLASEYLCK